MVRDDPSGSLHSAPETFLSVATGSWRCGRDDRMRGFSKKDAISRVKDHSWRVFGPLAGYIREISSITLASVWRMLSADRTVKVLTRSGRSIFSTFLLPPAAAFELAFALASYCR